MFGRGWTEDSRPWAVALLRGATNEDAGADRLDDGAVLRRTRLGYVAMTLDGLSAHAWLAALGDELAGVHDDPRGVLFFPDVLRVRGRTYAEVVQEVGWSGVWVPPALRSDASPPDRAP